MKALTVSLFFLFTSSMAISQITVSGVSPAAIQGNYSFGVQENSGAWPGQIDNGTWGVINSIDFNIPGTYVFDTLMMVEDGTPGLNSEYNPISQEGCNPLTNNLTGKIAVIYASSCGILNSLLNAQNAGAVAAIIIGKTNNLIDITGDAINGINITIPSVFLSRTDGHMLTREMNNGPVTLFIGNKINAFNNDIGSAKGEFLIAPYGSNHYYIFNGFELGLTVYNSGVNDQLNASVQATIEGPNGIVYDESITFSILAGDTLSLFPGNTLEFPAYNAVFGSFNNGDYILRYTISMDSIDDFPFDNVFEAEFDVQDNHFSKSRSSNYNPVSTNYPLGHVTDYQSCIMVQEPNFNGLVIDGMTVVPHIDTSLHNLAKTEIAVNAYVWDDNWTDLNDPNYTFDPTLNDAYQNILLLNFGYHQPQSNNEVNQPVFVPFQGCVFLQNDVRYLFCIQSYYPALSFGYDNGLDYSANYTQFAQPISPVQLDGQWYTDGWNRPSAPSISLSYHYCNLEERNQLQGNLFPNPANDVVTVSVNANGDATIRIVDVAGKVVYNAPASLVNGQTTVNIASFDAGVYVFSVITADGKSAQFNVVKK